MEAYFLKPEIGLYHGVFRLDVKSGTAFVQRLLHLFIGHGLEEIALRLHLIGIQSKFGRGGQEDDPGIMIGAAQLPCGVDPVLQRHQDIQKYNIHTCGGICGKQSVSAVKPKDLRRHAAFHHPTVNESCRPPQKIRIVITHGNSYHCVFLPWVSFSSLYSVFMSFSSMRDNNSHRKSNTSRKTRFLGKKRCKM